MARFYEGLKDRVTSRWRTVEPEPTGSDTAVAPAKADDDGYASFPLGSTSLIVGAYEERVKLIHSRQEKYSIYNEMDAESPEFKSALDIYADNATRGDSEGNAAITIKSETPRVASILEEVRRDLDLDAILWTLVRDIAKYGERAEEVVVNSQFRIARLKPLPTLQIIPQVDEYGRKKDPAYVQVREDRPEEEVAKFADWQVVYFANKLSRADLHGEGVGFATRRAFLQLRMMEDAVVIARLTRAHNRLAYMVETGGLDPNAAQKHLAKVKAALRKSRAVDPHTGKMLLESSPLAIEEDIFIATNKESKADVKVLQGDLTLGNLADLEYFQNKMFAGWKVPKVYLAAEKDTRSRAVITEADIQFARSVRRLQHIVEQGLRHIFDLALLLRGVNPKSVTYHIGLPVISIIDELRVWQAYQLKFLCAQMFKQTFWPDDEWLLKELLGFEDDVVARLIKGQVKPDKFNGLYQAPKVGNAPKNSKISSSGTSESAKTKADLIDALTKLPDEEFTQFEAAAENLRFLINWQLEERAA